MRFSSGLAIAPPSSASMASSRGLHRASRPARAPSAIPARLRSSLNRARGRRRQGLVAFPEVPWGHGVSSSCGTAFYRRAARPRIAERAPEAAHWRRRPPRMTPRLALVLLAALTLSCGGGGSSPTSRARAAAPGRPAAPPRAVHVRARRSAGLLLLVQGAPEPRPGLVLLARGVPRRRALPPARLELQLHHSRPRATPSTRTASSSASASPTSGRPTPSCGSRRPSPAARPPTPGWTAGTRS